jgi:hypothetical protein
MLEPMHLYHAIHVKPCLQFLCSASFHRLEPQLKEARLGREASEYRIASTEKTPKKLSSYLQGDKLAPPNFTIQHEIFQSQTNLL